MSRVLAALLLAVSLTGSIVSCSGSSFEGGGTSGGSGGTGNGGASGGSSSGAGGNGSGATSSGGTDASGGGSTSTAGSAAGGDGPVGGAPGASGAPGAGGDGSTADICSLPADSGDCDAAFPSFFHNAETGVCEPFVYGGCGGNENRFLSVEQCQASCNGGTPNLDSCEHPSDCVLVQPECCGQCDGGIKTYAAVNVDAEADYVAAVAASCNVACAACEAPDPTTANRPYLTATCIAGECVPIDVREEGVTICLDSVDCHLRMGVGCCEGCGDSSTNLVAVSDEAKLSELVCGDELVPCLGCAPIYPPGYAAACETGGCVLTVVDAP